MRNGPQLRFPDYNDDYEVKTIRELSNIISKGTTPKIMFEKGDVKFYKIENIGKVKKFKYISTETHTGELSRSVLHEDDLLVSIAGSLGETYVVGKDDLPANTNQALAFVRLKDKDYLHYIKYHMETEKMTKYIRRMVSVGAQPNLNLQQIGNYTFRHGNKNEIKKIVTFFEMIDSKIELLKDKLENLKLFKRGISSKVFINNNWDKMQIGDLLNYEQPTKYRTTNIESDKKEYNIPVLTANKSFLLGYTNDTDGIYTKGDVILFDDFTTLIKYVDFPFKVKSSALKILTPKAGVNLKFVYEAIQHIEFNPDDHKRYYISEYQNQDIRIPDETSQSLIVEKINNINFKMNFLDEKLKTLNQFKKGLLQQMFI